MKALELAQRLTARFGDSLSAPAEFRGEITLALADPERIAEVCQFAKSDLGFDYLVDITSIDNYGDDPRFTLVYHLYGYGHLQQLRLKTSVGEEKCEAPTVITVWRSADWHEREIFDMMGIRVLKGRTFTENDLVGTQRVAVVFASLLQNGLEGRGHNVSL